MSLAGSCLSTARSIGHGRLHSLTKSLRPCWPTPPWPACAECSTWHAVRAQTQNFSPGLSILELTSMSATSRMLAIATAAISWLLTYATIVVAPEHRFDFILVNSFLHHLDDTDTLAILTHLRSLLTEDGHIHMLELVLPERPSIARLLAKWDRGNFARAPEKWQQLFEQLFEPVVHEQYPLTGMGITLWNMVYCKGRSRV